MLSTLICLGKIYPSQSSNESVITYTIKNDTGGVIREYVRRALTYEQAQVTIKFDGSCYSSCTLLMSDFYSYDKCMTHDAFFGFHEPYSTDPESEGVKEHLLKAKNYMWYSYHPVIQAYLNEHGWPSVSKGDSPDKVVIMLAEDLEGVLRYCD